MSERHKKRTKQTHKKCDTSLRNLPPRQGDDGVQAQPQSVPQRQGAGVAETDTATRRTGGQKIMDKIRQYKQTLIQIGIVMGIAAIISATMVLTLAASKGDLAQAVENTQTDYAVASAHYTEIRGDVDDIKDRLPDGNGILLTSGALDAVTNQTQVNSQDISALQVQQDLDHAGLLALNATVSALPNSLPEAYLTGTFGDYTLHAKCSEAGNYTANINLVYSPPVWIDGGNETIEEALVELSPVLNWITPATAYNGTHWALTSVVFNIGVFELDANVEKAIPVAFGNSSSIQPSYAYVEIWRVT
jgi:hypothetical protein